MCNMTVFKFSVVTLCLCTSFLTLICVVHGEVLFDASNYNVSDPSTHVSEVYTNAIDTKVITIQNVPSSVAFFIIQAHRFLNDITLSKYPSISDQYYVNGTNIGLVQVNSFQSFYQFYLWSIENVTSDDVILIVLSLYKKGDPIPGGCNLSFDVEIAPYQQVSFDKDMVKVNVQAPSLNSHTCEENVVRLETYRIFLNERDISSESYFDGINKMITVESIRRHGWKIEPKTNGNHRLRTLYSAYPGTGSVYAVIAVYNNSETAYVPAVSYACDPRDWSDSCLEPASTHWKVFWAFAFFWGLAVCFFGHNFFVFFMFTVGSIFGGIITYSSIVRSNVLPNDWQNFCLLIIVSQFYGFLWSILWKKIGSPLFSISLALLLNGMLIAAVLFQGILSDIYVFQSDLNYWTVFSSIVFAFGILQAGTTVTVGSIVISSTLGSFITTLAIDHYIGSYLRYIVLNVIRRARAPDFNLAIVSPPMQSNDGILLSFWCLLLSLGVYYQLRRNRGRAPFPSNVGSFTETTPLLFSVVH